jgi:hypothetical protein
MYFQKHKFLLVNKNLSRLAAFCQEFILFILLFFHFRPPNQSKVQCLVELEYVYAHNGKNGQRFVYELVFDGEFKHGHCQLMGLIDVEQLKQHNKNNDTTNNLPALDEDLPPSFRPASCNLTDSLHTPKNGAEARAGKPLTLDAEEKLLVSTNPVNKSNGASHRNPVEV